MGHPTCIIEGLACWLTLCILEKIICNSTNSVQISFIETLKLIVFSWTIWWCYWQNVLMINEKNNFLTVSWLSGLLSAEIFISTGEWGVQMPPLTSENSYFLRSGPQGATLVMWFMGVHHGGARHWLNWDDGFDSWGCAMGAHNTGWIGAMGLIWGQVTLAGSGRWDWFMRAWDTDCIRVMGLIYVPWGHMTLAG